MNGIVELAVPQRSNCAILELHLVCRQSPGFVAENMLNHAKLLIQSERTDLAESLSNLAEHLGISLHAQSLGELYDFHRYNQRDGQHSVQ